MPALRTACYLTSFNTCPGFAFGRLHQSIKADLFEVRLQLIGLGKADHFGNNIKVVVVVQLHVKRVYLVQPDGMKGFISFADQYAFGPHQPGLFVFIQYVEVITCHKR